LFIFVILLSYAWRTSHFNTLPHPCSSLPSSQSLSRSHSHRFGIHCPLPHACSLSEQVLWARRKQMLSVITGFIKGQVPRKLTTVRSILPAWFDRMNKSYSYMYKEVQFKTFCLPVNTSCLGVEHINEVKGMTDKVETTWNKSPFKSHSVNFKIQCDLWSFYIKINLTKPDSETSTNIFKSTHDKTLLWPQSKTNLPDTVFTYHNSGAHQNCHHNHCHNHKPI